MEGMEGVDADHGLGAPPEGGFVQQGVGAAWGQEATATHETTGGRTSRGGGMGGADGDGVGRIALASFISADGLHVRPGRREQSLLALLQLATSAGHQAAASTSNSSGSGIVLTLGHGNHTEWIRANLDMIFREDGPLGGFNPIRPERLCKWIKEAETCAKIYYSRDHSNDEIGADQEDPPPLDRTFLQSFRRGIKPRGATRSRVAHPQGASRDYAVNDRRLSPLGL